MKVPLVPLHTKNSLVCLWHACCDSAVEIIGANEMVDVSCIVNAHDEGHVIHPTIRSVKRAVNYAESCGLEVDIHIVLDDSDDLTISVVESALEGVGAIHAVSYKDLSTSRNHARNESAGEYLAFIDGDDLWCHTWLVDAYMNSMRVEMPVVFHPEYNIYFGDESSHVFHHVDMDSPEFDDETLLKTNYWTALSFARKCIYEKFPYSPNKIEEGFGYEDWTWNHETIANGVRHKVVPGTAHFIRRGKPGGSLLELTNSKSAIPRILDIYSR